MIAIVEPDAYNLLRRQKRRQTLYVVKRDFSPGFERAGRRLEAAMPPGIN
jgi:hypothetical protein